jgi:hypothetical protein
MKRIVLAFVGLLVGVPGAALSVTFDVGNQGLQGSIPINANNYITVSSGQLSGQVSMGWLDSDDASVASNYVLNGSNTGGTMGALSFSATLGSASTGSPTPIQPLFPGYFYNTTTTDYAIQPGGSISLTGNFQYGGNGTAIGLASGNFSAGGIVEVTTYNYYSDSEGQDLVGTSTDSETVKTYYSAQIGSAFANIFGLTTSVSGGFFNLTENEMTTGAISGNVTLGTSPAQTPVPIPAALLLFAPALLGLIGIRKRL